MHTCDNAMPQEHTKLAKQIRESILFKDGLRPGPPNVSVAFILAQKHPSQAYLRLDGVTR